MVEARSVPGDDDNRVSRPPPYELHSNPTVVLSETTTTRTELVTTTTTTRFLSFPLWRKRTFPTTANVPRPRSGATVDDDMCAKRSLHAPSGSFMIEKDLPPTPASDEAACDSTTAKAYSANVDHNGELEVGNPCIPHMQKVSEDRKLCGSTSLTAALALTSLGIGLPPILSQNAVPLPNPPSQAYGHRDDLAIQPIRSLSSTIRKTKSANRLIGNFPSDQFVPYTQPSDSKPNESRSNSTKHCQNNDREQPTPWNRSVPNFLTRKASFWSRKKPGPSLTTSASAIDRSIAPLLKPVPISPFKIDVFAHPSSTSELRVRNRSGCYSLHPSLEKIVGVNHWENGRIPTPGYTANVSDYTTTPTTSPPYSRPGYAISFEQIRDLEHVSAISRPRSQTNPLFLNKISMSEQSISLFSDFSANTRAESIDHSIPSSHKPFSDHCRSSVDPSSFNGTYSPESYLRHLLTTVNKAEVAGVLASSSDPLNVEALKVYVGRFDFFSDPLDVALRKFLMDVGLPRETQQIDRVIEAFASRYSQCSPALFVSEDHPYILAFSLIMLHTDAFNKSNRRKMTKPDYLKNTKLPGVNAEVLDYFFDNIVCAPFIFVEDLLDVNGQRKVMPQTALNPSWIQSSSGTASTSSSVSSLRTSKIDPYHFITNQLLGSLRVETEAYVSSENPYLYEGITEPLDERELRQSFAMARKIELGGTSHGCQTETGSMDSTISPSSLTRDVCTFKVAKAGLLNRKDDILEGGKKSSNRRWRLCIVILTGSQLLFFRGPSSISDHLSDETFSQLVQGKPEELLSVKDAIAVYDKSYTKHENTFRFVLCDGRQLLLQANVEGEVGAWISRINYASAFKSTGVRMRPLELSDMDAKLIGITAANSYLRENHLEYRSPYKPTATSIRRSTESGSCSFDWLHLEASDTDLEMNPPIAPEIECADILKALYDEVKLNLAGAIQVDINDNNFLTSSGAIHAQYPNFSSRTQVVQSKIKDLNSRVSVSQTQLDTYARDIRNIATLTPFQKSTRDRLVAAMQAIAPRIALIRLELTKLICHRQVLMKDLLSEQESWTRVKDAALHAAREAIEANNNYCKS